MITFIPFNQSEADDVMVSTGVFQHEGSWFQFLVEGGDDLKFHVCSLVICRGMSTL